VESLGRRSVLGMVGVGRLPCLSPLWGFSVCRCFPMASAMGCILTPLCGCKAGAMWPRSTLLAWSGCQRASVISWIIQVG
jgi:hypothetical protein